MAAQQSYHDAPEVVPWNNERAVAHPDASGLEVAQPGKEVVPQYSDNPYDGEGKEAVVADGAASKSSRICGLSKKAFIIVACIVAVVIIAAAVGGGVGGSLAGKKSTSNAPASSSSSSSSTSSSHSTTSSPTRTSSSTTQRLSTATVTSIVGVATDMAGCPLANGTTFTAPSGDKYLKLCAIDILANNIDIAHTTGVTTFNACIGLCDSMNTQAGSVVCKAAVWDIVEPDYEFCWLKNATKVLTPQSNNGSVAAIRQ